MTMADIVANITSLVTAAISWMTSYVSAITSNNLLMLFILFGFIGTGVGLIKRIIRL